jgi:hypothetical protein
MPNGHSLVLRIMCSALALRVADRDGSRIWIALRQALLPLVVLFAVFASLPALQAQVIITADPDSSCPDNGKAVFWNGSLLYCFRWEGKKKDSKALVDRLQDAIQLRIAASEMEQRHPKGASIPLDDEDLRVLSDMHDRVGRLCKYNHCDLKVYSDFPPRVDADSIESLMRFLEVGAIRSFYDQCQSAKFVDKAYLLRIGQMNRAILLLLAKGPAPQNQLASK